MKEEEIKLEIQKAKEELQNLKLYIEELSSFLPLPVLTINPIGIIIHINKATENLTGYNSFEIVGEPINSLFVEKDKIEKINEDIKDKIIIQKEKLTLITKNKTEVPINIYASARKDKNNNYIGYFIGLVDITEIEKSQQELEGKIKERTRELEISKEALANMLETLEEAKKETEEERDRTKTIITSFVDGIIVFDENKKVALVNSQAEKLLDVKSEYILDKNILELTKFPSLIPIVEILGGEIKNISKTELTLKENLIVEISSIPLIEKNRKTGDLVILHDISRERFIEKMKTEFVSLAAHQLRTPLSAIKWILRMLLDGDIGEITPEQKDIIEKAYISNERMINLINDLLNVTKIEEGKYISKQNISDITEIVKSSIDASREKIENKKLKIIINMPSSPMPKIMMDEEKMKIAIQNLIENAIKYTNPKGKIEIFLKHDNRNIEFQIKDTGIGIPEKEKHRIFSKFFRGSNVIRMDTEGTGLGLFITKNIIEAHDGKIWFESKENKGTTFYVTLPIKKLFGEYISKKFY